VTASKGYTKPSPGTPSASDAVAGRCYGTTDCTNVLPDVSKTKSMYFLVDVCGNEKITQPSGTCSVTGGVVASGNKPWDLINDEQLNNNQWKEFRITPCKTYDTANP
jgi:hypothetical protein